MKKVFGLSVRDLKRGVNKKVLKVPGIEQKILDVTSNEPYGPHVSDMAALAEASRNYHDYQIIMMVIWKRLNATGKKWRHVYKALTVLEYLVAHGSERVIDEIKEHAYHISTLADFQYIDSNSRDQGTNIRKKSQILVALVSSKERIQEIRQKAQSVTDKYNGAPSSEGAGKHDDRFENGQSGNRDDERNGYGRENESDFRDDDKYGKGRNSYSKEGDRHSKDYDEQYEKDYYREENSDGSFDCQTRPSSQSVDGYTDRSLDDDDRQSSRSGGKADDLCQDERELNQTLPEHSGGAPRSYEKATNAVQNTAREKRDEPNSPSNATAKGLDDCAATDRGVAPNNEFDAFDEFDPRQPASAALPAASNQELDIFGLSAPDSGNALAIVTADANTTTFKDNFITDLGFGANFSTTSTNQAETSEDPFGDAPFKAIPHDTFPSQPQNVPPITSFQPSGSNYSSDTPSSAAPKVDSFPSFNFGNAFGDVTYAATDVNSQQPSGSLPFSASELPGGQSSDDILDSILPRTSFHLQEAQPAAPPNMQINQMNFLPHPGSFAQVASQGTPSHSQNFQMNPFQSSGFSASVSAQGSPTNAEISQMNSFQTLGSPSQASSQESPTNAQNLIQHSAASQGSPTNIQTAQGNFSQPSGVSAPTTSQGPVTNMSSGTSSPQGPETNMQSAEMNFFEQPGSSGSASSVFTEPSQGNMQPTQNKEVPASAQATNLSLFQSAQENYSQPSGVSAPATSQGSVTHMPSGTSSPQGPETNMQSAEMNFFEQPGSSGSASSAVSQPSQGNMQPTQMTDVPASQVSQTSAQATNLSFFQSSGLSAPVSSPSPTNMHHQLSGLSAPASFGAHANMSFQPSAIPAPVATSVPTNMQTSRSASPSDMQSNQFNLGFQSLAPQEAQVSAPTSMQAIQYVPPNNMPTAHFNGSQYMLPNPHILNTGQLTAQNYMHGTGHPAAMQPAYPNISSQATLSDSQAPKTAHAAPHSNMHATQFGGPAYMNTAPANLGSQPPAYMPIAQGNLGSQSMSSDPFGPQPTPATAAVPTKAVEFRPKSTVWADTLSRGLVNFNISGPKTNPMDDIGVDFDDINRKEKRLEVRRPAAPAVSTITMGKAMGSGSGLGRASAGGNAPPPNPIMGSGMGMGAGMNMGGYGGNMYQQHPMGMNMAMVQGTPGQPANGMPLQGPLGMPGNGYNPMMGMGGYGPKQPYGGGYR